MRDFTLLDGGMGTLLQAKGLQPGDCPEDWNVDRPDDVTAIHRAYVAAGSQIVYANTFGANRLKYHGKYTVEQVVKAAIANARKAADSFQDERRETRDVKVALDLGPTGRLLKPVGDLDFDEAVAAFTEVIKIATSSLVPHPSSLIPHPSSLIPDLIVIETMGDIGELKAAVVAAKECCDLPVYATVTLDASGKLLTGGSVDCVAALLESLGVDAYGFNCGLGPSEMLPHVERLAQLTTKPIIAKPNAGLPKVVDGKTVFTVGPEAFVRDVARLIDAGASVVGGCCGTTPVHIGELSKQSNNRTIEQSEQSNNRTTVSSGSSVVELRPHQGLIIGERINPTGKKALKEAYRSGDTAYVLREAVKQTDAGAAVLDVNCGVPGLDERALLDATVTSVQSVVNVPIQIDTADPAALERALRHVVGKPLVNSVNGKRESMDAVFPLVKKYGGAIVALCLDETGIPATSEGRLAIAKRILAEGEKYGFRKADFVFDALTLAVSADPQAAVVTLETVKRLTDELGVNTVLGVSNVSFGLPDRPALNNAMYALAKRAGLSAAIANPAAIRDEIDSAAEDVLLGRDPNCTRWIESHSVRLGSTSVGLESSSVGLGSSSVGLGSSSVGLESSSVGLESTSVGLESSSVGLGSSSVGLGSSSVGLGSSSVGLESSSVGLESSSVGLGSSSVGLGSSSVGLGSSSVGLESSSVGFGSTGTTSQYKTLADSNPTLVNSSSTLIDSTPTLADSNPTLRDPSSTLIDFTSTLTDPTQTLSDSTSTLPDSTSTLIDSNLFAAIRRGLRADARAAAAAALAAGASPLAVIQSGIVPALEEVGRGFEHGTVYLPQLLMAADAAGEAFAVVRKAMGSGDSSSTSSSSLTSSSRSTGSSSSPRAPVILATVKGDIHDIGKNIVRALLENYGFEVIDLGRDVPPETIVETARRTNAALVGLSALMTTTVGAMTETIRQLKAAGLACKTVVGGAVVTQEFADEIGADFYAKDAMRTVRIAESLIR